LWSAVETHVGTLTYARAASEDRAAVGTGDGPNVLCALGEALSEPGRLSFIDCGGELYIYRHE